MNTVQKADTVLKDLLFIVVFSIVIFFAVRCFAEETVVKVDAYSARITISNITEKDGVKTTLSQEKNFKLEELNTAKTASETALQSWVDAKAKTEENIVIQTAQVALWQKLIDDAVKLGIIVEPELEAELESKLESKLELVN